PSRGCAPTRGFPLPCCRPSSYLLSFYGGSGRIAADCAWTGAMHAARATGGLCRCRFTQAQFIGYPLIPGAQRPVVAGEFGRWVLKEMAQHLEDGKLGTPLLQEQELPALVHLQEDPAALAVDDEVEGPAQES